MSSELDLNLGGSDDNPKQDNAFKSALKNIGSLIMRIPRKARIVLSLLGITFLIISLLVSLQPQAKKRPVPETIVRVDTIQVAESDYPILVSTNGTIQADTRGSLVSQIRGEIVQVSDKFKTGGAFSKGEVLIEVDQRDYLAAQSQALAALSQAEAGYRQEVANAKQAQRDWERLGNTGRPPELVARKPQLAAAQAQMESAKASLETAKLNLERTKIKAPYTGRVIQRQAVLGQYVSTGSVLAEIFATDAVEVRLPLSQDEFSQLGLDALSNSDIIDQFAVTLSTKVGQERYFWDARVTRTDSTFDLNTRQIDVIATVIDPFASAENKPPLKIGQFVNANIRGRIVKNAMVVPNKALREGNYVFVSQDERLVRRPVVVAWQDDQNALIQSGLNEGDLVVTTSLNSTLAGAKVKLSDSGDIGSAATNKAPAPVTPETKATPETKVTPEPEVITDKTSSDTAVPETGEVGEVIEPPEQADNTGADKALEQQLQEFIGEATAEPEPAEASEAPADDAASGSEASKTIEQAETPAESANRVSPDGGNTANQN